MTQHLAGRRGRKGMRGEGAGSEIQSFDLVGGCGRVAAARRSLSGTCATLWLAHRGQGSGTRLLIEESGLLRGEGLSSLVVTRLKDLIVCRMESEKTRRFLLATIHRLYGFSIFGRVQGKTRKGVLHHTVTARP